MTPALASELVPWLATRATIVALPVTGRYTKWNSSAAAAMSTPEARTVKVPAA